MSSKIMISLMLGIVSGIFLLPEALLANLDSLVMIALYIMIFWVGVDIGGNKEVLEKIKNLGIKVLLVPMAVIIGSLFGAIVLGFFFGMSINESGAIGSGLGWYSLSAVMITEMHSASLGAMSFLTNVLRELIAIVSIPIIAKKMGYLEACAPAAAAGMDTVLPIVSAATSPDTAVISFISGAILSTMVPILVQFFLG